MTVIPEGTSGTDTIEDERVLTEEEQRIVFLRNELTCWALAKHSLTLQELSAHIIELDSLLQDRGL